MTIEKYKFGEEVTVDFDSESYYYGDQYFGSWDDYGEQTAEDITKLLRLGERRVINIINKDIDSLMDVARKSSDTEEVYALLVLMILKKEIMGDINDR